MTLETIPTKQDRITHSFYSELMENYAPQLPVDVRHDLMAIRENRRPAVFSVGNDQKLNIIFSTDESETGWEQHALSGGLGNVTAFGVRQSSEGSFRLGMAVRKNDRSHFYMSPLTRLSDIDFSAFDPLTFWNEFTLPDPSKTVDRVEMDAKGALIATKKTDREDALYYTIDEKNGVQTYTLPENGSDVHAMALGSVYGKRGVFLLYQVGGDRTMLFQSFPDPVYKKRASTALKRKGSSGTLSSSPKKTAPIRC